MHLLYPCDPFNKKKPDEAYEEEFCAAQHNGFTCFLFSFEDFECGEFRPHPAKVFEGDILYRGWMLTPERYAQLQESIELMGATVVVTAENYRRCHYLPEWYDQCKDLTPTTITLAKNDDFSLALSTTGWNAYFVKDFVKSLTTSRGSVAKNAAEVHEVVTLIERYRGKLEGGVCIREFEDLLHETEERYFVLRGKVLARNGIIPDIVQDIARRIESPFFSVDIVFNTEGKPRLIELGDGQVSDRKQWPANTFIEALNSAV
ncbi:ATP-grasp domain-containing protein [Undibacterium sp. CY7W]|uniref:ATP-grasp domain-containing protein n=1 Tax=Undibacterium rugosum TaxID=2762291 RepID=A0A923KZ52_9BURK|nr:ATP-grasp domain-containing protein [Undibacterium rugosum]MBC3935510.1 ATP-grasp domain-containing protein [Undibacterium rugosum]